MREKKKKGLIDYLLILAGLLFLAVFVVTGILLVRYYLAARHEQKLDQKIYQIRQNEVAGKNETVANGKDSTEDSSLGIKTSELYAMNQDYVAFLSIPDTDIFYPVVQRDNQYYLNHDFEKNSNSHGAIFLDENCDLSDSFIMLHGHHMRDKTMFAQLDSFKKQEFRDAHKSIYLDTGAGDEACQIFAVALIDLTPDDFFHYEDFPDTEEERVTYLKRLQKNAIWYTDPDEIAAKGSQIMLLSTCSYGTDDQRLVVACVKLD